MSTTASVKRKLWANAGRNAILPLATLMLVGLMVVPVPATVLDIGFITNIMISLAVLMVALNAAKPFDFSSFPTVLLFATLLRLALNVASTRVVLVAGHTGEDAAGHVIEAFGSFLIGGDYAVGLFVFGILMIINLVVITKGAGRVSEVSARFTLDALPGKQMAIDADLNAGLLTPEEAKARRQEVATEADFYGSMDGASKFVKGDAVAGVLILVVNIFGGLVLGTVSHGLSLSEAASTYVLLAIGDALVAQIPALLLSIAAAAIVTRVSSPLDLSHQITSQFGASRAWVPVAGILGFLGILPGMPHLIILPAAAIAGYIAWRLSRPAPAAEVVATTEAEEEPAPNVINGEDVSDAASLSLELGYGLIGLVDERKGAPLMGRITGIRKQLSRELGFVVPLVRVRDNLALEPNSYRISVAGVVMGEDQCWPDDLLALYGGASGQIIAGTAADLFGMDETQRLLDALKSSAPQLVQGLTPAPLSLAQIAALCRALLAEGIPLKDFRRIAEAMVDAAREESEPNGLVEAVRLRIGALIVQTLVPVKMPLQVITLEAGLESLLAQAVRTGPNATHPFEPALSNRIIEAVGQACQPLLAQAARFAIVTSPIARRALSRLLRPHLPDVPVLSFLEIPDGKPVEVCAIVGNSESQPPYGAATGGASVGAPAHAGHPEMAL